MRSLMEFFFGVKRSKKSGRKSNNVSANGMDFIKPAFTKPSPKGLNESLQLQEPISVTYTWKIQGWSKIPISVPYIMSNPFRLGEYDLCIGTYPKGFGNFKNKSLSINIVMAKTHQLPPNKEVYLVGAMTMKDQIHGNHKSLKCHSIGTEQGRCSMGKCSIPAFLPLKELNDPAKGFLVNDTCIIEATLTFMGFRSCET